jgi:hypothetical protein
VRNRNEHDGDLAFRFYAILQPLAFESRKQRRHVCKRKVTARGKKVESKVTARGKKVESNRLQGK